LSINPDSVQLEIKDDGVGFDPDSHFPGHLGLHTMRERTERLGGTYLIESRPQHGTRLVVEMPVLR
jgi:signal transduction histidine kinase